MIFGVQIAFQTAKDAFQIIELRREDVAVVRSEKRSRLPTAEEEIIGSDLLNTASGCFRHQVHESALGIGRTEEGKGIHIGFIGHAVIGCPIHVDRNIGDHQKIPIQINQLLPDRAAVLDQDPAGYGQGSIKPG